ncbi:MAG: hypothetical protein CMI52_01905 [Parcubacteria group bacterium]|nr:hypothetical protein [Parcubacteria group bacterium]|tara:strand:- start:95 stop:754 length:660 start_codon:yes stop_codon:yes gene_type:complete
MSELSTRDSVVVHITGTGEHRAPFDLVSFTVTCKAHAQTSREAKKKLDGELQPLLTFFAGLEERGVIARKASTSDVGYAYKRVDREHLRDGFEATYMLVFSTKQMELVNGLFDDLTELSDEYIVSSPSYLIEDSQGAESEALKAAWEDVQRQLKEQCELLGKNHEHLVICYWQTGDTFESHGKGTVRANAAGLSDRLFAGKAVVKVHLTVGYGIGNKTS